MVIHLHTREPESLAWSSVSLVPWYDSGMTTKITVSLPDELVDAARRAVTEGRSSSVSAFIASAMADKTRFDDLEALLADMAAESGPPDESDRRWAREALGLI
jgi:Arc/MetJ-type ribon-helix-helix transcriptional regulator